MRSEMRDRLVRCVERLLLPRGVTVSVYDREPLCTALLLLTTPYTSHITYIDIRLMPASETRVLYGFTYALERHLRAGLAATCAPFVPRLAPPWTPRAPRPWQRPTPAASRPARSYASPSRPAQPRRAGLGCACGCACGCGCGCESGAPGAGRLAPGAPALHVGCRVPRPGHGLRTLQAAHAMGCAR